MTSIPKNGERYLSCIECGKPKNTRATQRAQRCHECENKRRAAPIVDGKKVCIDCGFEKPVAEFGKKAGTVCMKCQSIRSLAWNKSNPQKKNDNNRKYYANNTEKVSKRDKEYRKNNLQKIVAYGKSYYQKNKAQIDEWKRGWNKENAERLRKRRHELYDREKSVAAAREWRRKNPDKVRIIHTKRRTALRNLPSDLTPTEWQEIKDSYDNKCVYCGKPASTLDHLVPVNKGGGNTKENAVPACRSCNSSKQDKSLLSFLLDRFRNG